MAQHTQQPSSLHLKQYEKVPSWIEHSPFVKQYRIDFPGELLQVSPERIFELPLAFAKVIMIEIRLCLLSQCMMIPYILL